MVKRFWKLYRSVILCVAICIAVLACSAGYTVGVVGMNNVIAQIDVNIGSIEAYLEKNQNATELLTEEFKEDYSAKTRTIAMLLSQDSSFITDDRTLEELRVTVNADMISISDHEGNVIASTDPSGAGNSIREEFRSHLTDDVYTDVLFLLDSDTPTIFTGRRKRSGTDHVFGGFCGVSVTGRRLGKHCFGYAAVFFRYNGNSGNRHAEIYQLHQYRPDRQDNRLRQGTVTAEQGQI